MSEAGYCLIARDALIAAAGGDRASRFGAGGQSRRRPRQAAAAREARIAPCLARREPASARTRSAAVGCSLSASASASSARRGALGFPRCDSLPGNARCGTTASKSSLRQARLRPSPSARSAKRTGAISVPPHPGSRAAALCRRHAAGVLAGEIDRASATWTSVDDDEATVCFSARFVNAPSTRRI